MIKKLILLLLSSSAFFYQKKYQILKVKIEILYNYMDLNNINKISFLKIDTEDHKYEILKGLKKNSICRYDNV